MKAPPAYSAADVTPEPRARQVPTLVFWALGLLLLIPVWVGQHFPAEDGLAHLYWVDVYRQLGNAATPWTALFERNVRWYLPHQSLYFVLQYGFSSILEPHLAQKVIISLTILAWITSIQLLSKAIAGEVTLGALASLLLIHSAWLYGGFFAFVLGVPILLVSLALIFKIFHPSATAAPPRRLYIVLGLMGVMAYFAHFFVAALFVLLLSLAILFHWRRFPARARSLAMAAVPSGLLIVSYLLLGSSFGKGGALRWEPIEKAAARFVGLAFFRGFGAGTTLFWLALALLGAILITLCYSAVRAYLRGELPDSRRFPLLVAACLALFYVVSPERVGRAANFNGRLQFAMWFWLLPSLPYRMSGRVRTAMLAGISLLIGWQVVDFSLRSHRFNKAYAAVLEHARALPPGSTLQPVLQYGNARFEGSFIRVLAHSPEDIAYHCRCALLSSFFTTLPFYWVRERPDISATPQYLLDYAPRRGSELSLVITENGLSSRGKGTTYSSP